MHVSHAVKPAGNVADCAVADMCTATLTHPTWKRPAQGNQCDVGLSPLRLHHKPPLVAAIVILFVNHVNVGRLRALRAVFIVTCVDFQYLQ